MRLLVTGAGGQVGRDLMQLASAHPAVDGALGFDRAALDLTDPAAVSDVIADQARLVGTGDLVVINAAAWTNVDGAETDEAGALAVNATGPGELAAACARHGARLLHISTDYVFPGDRPPQGPPYRPSDPVGPRSAYGRTKEAGERLVRSRHPQGATVVRTAWVYDGLLGANFVSTMARLAGEREFLDVVDDQRGSPTWSRDLAAGLLELAATPVPAGILHATNAGETTWFGFAQAIFAALGHDPARVRPTTTAAFPRPAPRPAYSVLDGAAWAQAGLTAFRDWPSALRAALEV